MLMPQVGFYLSDKLYADLAAAQPKMGTEAPGPTAVRIISRVFADNRTGERVRGMLGL